MAAQKKKRYRDDDDSDDDDLDELPAGEEPHAPDVGAVLLSFGVVICFGVIGYAASLTWFTLQTSSEPPNSKPLWTIKVDGLGRQSIKATEEPELVTKFNVERLPAEVSPEGRWIMWIAVLVAAWLVVGVVLLLIPQMPPALWRALAIAVPGVASAAAILFVIWYLSWIGKVVLMSRELNDQLGKMTITLDKENRRTKLLHETGPSFGLYLGLGAALAVAVGASYLAGWGLGSRKVRIFELVGFLAGGLVVGLKVQPWKATQLSEAMLGWFKFVDTVHRGGALN